jgi:hypothetical protein
MGSLMLALAVGSKPNHYTVSGTHFFFNGLANFDAAF